MYFGHACDVDSVNENVAFIRIKNACNAVHQSRFAGTVGTDNGDKVSFFERQVHTAKRLFLIRRVGEESLMEMSNLKHRLPPNAS